MLKIPDNPEEVPIFEYVMTPVRDTPHRGIPDCLGARAGENPPSLLIRYEDMRAEPAQVLAEILAFMHIMLSPGEVEQVVELTSFENMKRLEQNQTFDSGSRRLMIKDPDNPNAYKVRRGKVGGYSDYFDEGELEEIDRLIASLPPMYAYRPQGSTAQS